jgi:hypothetical protein
MTSPQISPTCRATDLIWNRLEYLGPPCNLMAPSLAQRLDRSLAALGTTTLIPVGILALAWGQELLDTLLFGGRWNLPMVNGGSLLGVLTAPFSHSGFRPPDQQFDRLFAALLAGAAAGTTGLWGGVDWCLCDGRAGVVVVACGQPRSIRGDLRVVWLFAGDWLAGEAVHLDHAFPTGRGGFWGDVACPGAVFESGRGELDRPRFWFCGRHAGGSSYAP